MFIFLKDREKAYTYKDLLDRLNEASFYKPCCVTTSLYDYFNNLILGLIAGESIVLLDADISVLELNNLGSFAVNEEKKINKPFFKDIRSVIKAINDSASEIVIFTSGTTGQPKKVIHSITTLTRAVRIGSKYEKQIWAFAYNPTHMAGLQVFFQAFENVNTIINVFGRTRKDVYQEIEENQITHLSATPTFYRLLLPFDKPLYSVCRVTLGGEKSDEKLYRTINYIFPNAKINNVYASTEAGSLFAAKGDRFQIPESIHDKIVIRDNELLVHKSLLGESDSFIYSGDYYCTGDIVEWVDEISGLFRFKSRKNELINVGGYKVNPEEVESLILQIDEVQQVVVYGKANAILGNVLCAEVRLIEGINLTELDIREILQEKLQDFKIPRRIKFVKELSLTRTGKLKRP